MDKEKYILLTIDVEDWFQVENFRPWIPFKTWDQRELRVERNVHQLLNLFDSVASAGRLEARGQKADGLEIDEARKPEGSKDFELSSFPASQPQAEGSPKATFFVLGWIAERLPDLVREIHSRGHEVASHGYNHNLCKRQPHADLKKELIDSKKLLEDITGLPISGFRAPNFSINDDALKTAEDCGYLYDSSYNSFGQHGRYGKISLNGHRKKGIAHQISDNFFELPISNLMLAGRTFPLGGGAYFRLIPFHLFSLGIKNILKKENGYLFYIHPWEVDPEQPRVDNASYFNKFKHYNNISQTGNKLKKLIKDLNNYQFITCNEYLGQVERSGSF